MNDTSCCAIIYIYIEIDEPLAHVLKRRAILFGTTDIDEFHKIYDIHVREA